MQQNQQKQSRKRQSKQSLKKVANNLLALIPKDLTVPADSVERLKNSRSMRRLAMATKQSEEQIRQAVFKRDKDGNRIPLRMQADEWIDLNDVKAIGEYTRYLFELGGNDNKAKKLKECCDWVSFAETDDGRRQLYQASYCKDRMCPICAPINAHKNVVKYYSAIDLSHKIHSDVNIRELFLTLTTENCEVDKVDAELSHYKKSISRLTKHTPFKKAILGWLWVIEITYNSDTKTVNVHAHAILQVDGNKYFYDPNLYISQEKWVAMWRKAAKLDYDPVVHITTAKTKEVMNRDEKVVTINESMAAVKEVVKYSFKVGSIFKKSIAVEEQAYVLNAISNALHGQHLIGTGGFIKEAVKLIKAKPELATYEDEATDPNYGLEKRKKIKPEEVRYISYYRYDFGVRKYFLTDRIVVPQNERDDIDLDNCGYGIDEDAFIEASIGLQIE